MASPARPCSKRFSGRVTPGPIDNNNERHTMKKASFLTLAALTLAVSTVGCVGKNNGFALFNKIYDWNLTASDNEWVNEIIFLGLCIIPVYPICLFADTIVFNSIDFWTGDNPIVGVDSNTGKNYAIVPNGDGRTATFTYDGQVCQLTRTDDGVTLTKDGVLLGTYTQQGDLVSFTAPDGTIRTTLR